MFLLAVRNSQAQCIKMIYLEVVHLFIPEDEILGPVWERRAEGSKRPSVL